MSKTKIFLTFAILSSLLFSFAFFTLFAYIFWLMINYSGEVILHEVKHIATIELVVCVILAIFYAYWAVYLLVRMARKRRA